MREMNESSENSVMMEVKTDPMIDPIMVANSLRSYPKIYNIGHRIVLNIFDDEVQIEEKIDGSQFSFGMYEDKTGRFLELRCRSKGAEINTFAPEKMFSKAVETAQSVKEKLMLNWTYRCEFLGRPKHNVLAYDREPKGSLVLFDVETGEGSFLSYEDKVAEAKT